MSEFSEENEAIKTAFWVSDLMTNGLPDMLKAARELEEYAPSAGAAETANGLVEELEGMALALGVLREALAEIAVASREGSA